jgi:RNA polymerase sigma factor (sigma-70 family)
MAAMSQTDEQLAATVCQRDSSSANWRSAQEACAELYRRHAQFLLAFLATRVHRADIDDLHQAIWERVWRYLPGSFKGGGNFRAWLYQIARSRLIDAARKKRPARLADDHDVPDPRAGAPGEPLLEQERLALLQRCLEQLAEHTAKLVRARLSGLDYQTISQELGLQLAQAHKLFHSAKSQLQDCITRSQA